MHSSPRLLITRYTCEKSLNYQLKKLFWFLYTSCTVDNAAESGFSKEAHVELPSKKIKVGVLHWWQNI